MHGVIVYNEQVAMAEKTVFLVENHPHLRAKEIAAQVSREFAEKHGGLLYDFFLNFIF